MLPAQYLFLTSFQQGGQEYARRVEARELAKMEEELKAKESPSAGKDKKE